MELEEAIEILKSYENKLVYEISEKDKEAVTVVLNHLTKQEKMIELMAEELAFGVFDFKSKEQAKQYFEKKAEESE